MLRCLLLALLLTLTSLWAVKPLVGLPWSYSGPPDKGPVARHAIHTAPPSKILVRRPAAPTLVKLTEAPSQPRPTELDKVA